MKVGIAGLGLIGGSLALALRDRHEVTGYDNDERARAAAKADGIRTFERYTRNTFDVNAIPLLKRLTHLPVIADPSHGTGKWYLVAPVALAAVAAGADGLLVEVHPSPDHALSDGFQSLTFDNFRALMAAVPHVARAVGRTERVAAP